MFGEKGVRQVGGCALAMMCVLFGALPTAQAFEVNDTSSGQPIHWEEGAIVLQTDPSIEFAAPGAAAAIAEGVTPWSSVEGAPALSVQAATVSSQPSYDSRNVIYFYPHGYEPAGAALAITIVTYDDTTGSILDTDMVLNGIYSFAALPAGATPDTAALPVSNDGATAMAGGGSAWAARGTFDLVHVVAHETGHALGMRDEIVNHAPVMYLFTLPGDASRRAPTIDDLDGIKEIYAGVSPAQGCSSSTMSPRRPRVSPLALAGALLVVAIGWAFAGRRRLRARGPAVLAGALAIMVIGPTELHVGSPSGDATARVVAVRDVEDVETAGPWRTEVTLSPTVCRISACPSSVTVTHWGGRRGHLVQQVGEFVPPRLGDNVEIVREDGAEGASRFRILEDRP
jgi:hypothetical protein